MSERGTNDGSSAERRWRIRVDVGGTFTDCVAHPPGEGARIVRVKVLSSGRVRGRIVRWLTADEAEIDGFDIPPSGVGHLRLGRPDDADEMGVRALDPARRRIRVEAPLSSGMDVGVWEIRSDEPAPVLAARIVTGTPFGDPLPPLDLRLATTRATNALLERTVPAPSFFVTAGFEDLLRIGDQRRPDLFALDARRDPPLHGPVVGVVGRRTRAGEQLVPLDLEAVRKAARRHAPTRSAAVVLLHADVDSAQEVQVAEVLREEGFDHVSISSELSVAIGLLARAETTVANAALTPVIQRYLHDVEGCAGASGMHVMTSAGGLVPLDRFHPKDSLLSGPAAGVVGALRIARRTGIERAITFDMGGTSTDVCRIDAEGARLLREHAVGGARIRAPAMPVHTVAAGGGSICRHDARGLGVGPGSAGAEPGPACYGAGGPLTVTDLNLLLGRLPESWVAVPIDRSAAERALGVLRRRMPEAPPEEALLSGLLEIANERMANAIRRVTIEEGHDPADHALIAFGGAGGQHACAVAERLGITTILLPEDAGILSAHGLDAAEVEALAERQILRPFDEVWDRIPEWIGELEKEALCAAAESGPETRVRRRLLDLRFRGQEEAIAVPVDRVEEVRGLFAAEYRRLYGHLPEGRTLEAVGLRLLAGAPVTDEAQREAPEPYDPDPSGTRPLWARGGWLTAPTFDRDALRPGAIVRGPALIRDPHGVVVIEPGWRGRIDAWRTVGITREQRSDFNERAGAEVRREPRAEPVLDELFTQRFTAIVEEMGTRLARSAVSVNVRERLDFSCAILDARGELVASAPHIPVHLGALGVCTRAVRDALPLGRGDVALTNHPGFGGSHLPDVTLVAPVYSAGSDAAVAYLAARAHHAEIGGTAPGSMPAGATSLVEEGVSIPPMHLIRSGEPRWQAVVDLLTGAAHPTRAIADNLADLEAALAACRFGVDALEHLIVDAGAAEIDRRMTRLARRAERALREALRSIPDGERRWVERLDDGSPLAVRLRIMGDAAEIDFEGTAGVHPRNLNATPAIVRSVVLYVLRLLVREPLPLNEGVFRAVSLRIPEGMLNPPFSTDPAECPAVVGGNVETSQRLTDALIGALGLAAASQGSMNNVLFGDDRFGYYETIGGGGGAGPGWPGASGTQVHMTNTRITDPEVLEHRFPVRLLRFCLRSGSGGCGRWQGGEGVVREIEFTAPLHLSMLAEHRVERPFGRHGGGAGAVGRQHLERVDGGRTPLGGHDGCRVEAGDRLIVETPGGGGWGVE